MDDVRLEDDKLSTQVVRERSPRLPVVSSRGFCDYELQKLANEIGPSTVENGDDFELGESIIRLDRRSDVSRPRTRWMW